VSARGQHTQRRGNGLRKSFLVLGWKDVIIASIIKHRTTQERHGNYSRLPFVSFSLVNCFIAPPGMWDKKIVDFIGKLHRLRNVALRLRLAAN
jgi:hypothetical protein